MKLIAFAWSVVLLTALLVGADKQPNKLFFSSLKVGQKVSLKDNGDSFSITFFEDDEVPHAHKVSDIGDDFLVLENVAGIETTIPIYSIKVVERVRVKR